MNDDVLIKKMLDGDQASFQHAVTMYQGSMLSVAKAIVGSAIADEVVQEAWLSVIKALPNFERRSSLKTWILRIVSNCAKTRRRKEVRNFAMGNAQDLEQFSLPAERFRENGMWAIEPSPWSKETPDELLSRDQLRQTITSTINDLPTPQRTVLVLREFEGLEMDEICKILDISASNSRVLLHRARTQIWQAIDQHQSQ